MTNKDNLMLAIDALESLGIKFGKKEGPAQVILAATAAGLPIVDSKKWARGIQLFVDRKLAEEKIAAHDAAQKIPTGGTERAPYRTRDYRSLARAILHLAAELGHKFPNQDEIERIAERSAGSGK